MKRFVVWAILVVLALLVVRWLVTPRFDDEVLGQLTGRLYYLKRDSGVLNLYTCAADLSGERLIYSHRGQGEDNENVTGFRYDQAEDLIYLIAMEANEWTLFSISPEGGEATPLRKREASDEASFRENYIKPEAAALNAFSRKGSLYLSDNGYERLLKKYHGLYAPDLLPGFWPYGFSPDGRFLVYGFGQRSYIMDLSTGKVSRFVGGGVMQWVGQTPPDVSLARAPLEPGSSLYHPEPSRAISSDGKYVAATEINSQSVRLITIPLENTTEGAILRPTAATWTDRYKLDYTPLGWVSAERLVYVASGVQDQGPNAGEQGVAVWVTDVASGASEEIGFVPLSGSISGSPPRSGWLTSSRRMQGW